MQVLNASGQTTTASPMVRRQPGDRAAKGATALKRLSTSLTGLGLSLFTPLALNIDPAQAEGSLDLISNGGYRPYLEFQNISAGSIPRKTIVKVYAKAGEKIELASSAVGVGSGIIRYRNPSGFVGDCGGDGKINNRTAEVNRTYTPCVVDVNANEGIWEIDFVSPDVDAPLGTNPAARTVTSNWAQPANAGYVSAWDITVKNSSNGVETGRVYANYFAFNMGSNGIALNSEFTVLTREGYQYGVDLNGLDPYGFILFSNNSGYKDANGDPIFRSLQYVGSNPGTVPSSYSFQNPNAPDTSTDVTHKLFINPPDPTMPSSANSATGNTWLYSQPLPPPLPSNFEFVGVEGTSGQAGTNPLGGVFNFDSTGDSSYSITLDLGGAPDGSPDGVYGNANDRTFLGRAEPGSNSVSWDGLDGNGDPIAAGDSTYGAQINFYSGEAHFPMVDAENNPNGIKLQRLNSPSPPTSPLPDPFEVFYDDRQTADNTGLCDSNGSASNCYGTGSNPRQALNGVSSSGGAHRFSNNFGDIRGIDTWVYYPSNKIPLSNSISIREADLVLLKTDNTTTVAPGDPLTYTVTIENKGPSDVVGATFKDDLPPELTNATWTCAISNGTGSCGAASGAADTDNKISTTLDLNKDAIATYTISTQVSTVPPSGNIENIGIVKRPNDVTDPDEDNNKDKDTTTINILLNLTLVKRITAIGGNAITSHVDDTSSSPQAANDNHANWPAPGSNTAGISEFLAGAINGSVSPGEELEYTVYFLSSGNFPLTNVNLCDWVPPNTTYVANSAELFIDGATTTASTQFLTAGNAPTVPCPPGSNTNGAVVVNVVDATNQLPAATGPGTPSNAYGYIRFRVTVN